METKKPVKPVSANADCLCNSNFIKKRFMTSWKTDYRFFIALLEYKTEKNAVHLCTELV